MGKRREIGGSAEECVTGDFWKFKTFLVRETLFCVFVEVKQQTGSALNFELGRRALTVTHSDQQPRSTDVNAVN